MDDKRRAAIEPLMSDRDLASDTCNSSRSGRIRFWVRHLLYITAAVAAFLGIPGLVYVTGAAAAPVLLLAVLMSMQFVLILLVPPLRRRLLGRVTPDGSTQRT